MFLPVFIGPNNKFDFFFKNFSISFIKSFTKFVACVHCCFLNEVIRLEYKKCLQNAIKVACYQPITQQLIFVTNYTEPQGQ